MKFRDNYLNDMEKDLEFDNDPGAQERLGKMAQNIASYPVSEKQLKNKGELLGHFKSGRFLKTYINVYDQAVTGIAESKSSGRNVNLNYGFACLEEAMAEDSVLYIVINEEIYRIRYLKNAEMAAYLMNRQKAKAGADRI